MSNRKEKIVGFLILLLLAVFISFLMATPTMWLWNGVLTEAIQGVNKITLLQAWGLNILSSILFESVKTDSK